MGRARLQWVVCRSETRVVRNDAVACPVRGLVSGATCLGCRFLMTSSMERAGGGWCRTADEQSETMPAPVRAAAPSPARVVRVQPAPRRAITVIAPAAHPRT